jgi:hypothetical protein
MMPHMRSTVRIDDDLLLELKEQAHKEKVSLTRILNRALRAGLQTSRSRAPRKPRYQEETYAMGAPRVDLRKALALAAGLEDEEIVRKTMLRK